MSKVSRSDFECECARRGIAISKAVKNKHTPAEATTYYAAGREIGVVLKGNRPDWAQMLEAIK